MPQHGLIEGIVRSAERLSALRRDIHSHPELGFDVHRTAQLVAQRLREWGYEVETGVGRTGIVARLRHGSGARSIGLHSDMDALPIVENTGLP
jgi:hippurate hydrolase